MKIDAIDLYLALIIHPRHSENNLSFRFSQTLENTCLLKLGVTLERWFQ